MKTILLIEDDPRDVELAHRALVKSAIAAEIVVATDGFRALDILSTSEPSRPIELILLDLKLPKMDGLEVLRKIRNDAKTKLIPVVVLTSSLEERDLIESYVAGCNSYVRKPVDFGRFVSALSSLGLYWLSLNEGPPERRNGT